MLYTFGRINKLQKVRDVSTGLSVSTAADVRVVAMFVAMLVLADRCKG
jgi:hypothetical protein